MGGLDIKKIAVIGAGVMGNGIAQTCALAGYKTAITRKRKELFRETYERIKFNLEILIERGIITKSDSDAALLNLEFKESIFEAAGDADFVIETVAENMDLKKEIMKELDEVCPKHTIIASNTSSFSITELASATSRQDKIVGMHWWNPPHLMPLIEIVKGEKTSTETVNVTKNLAIRLGKVPVICKDSPGFLGVRLQAALVIEAIRMLEDGLATAEDIDTAVKMTLGLRLPILGPLEIVDLGGMDTFLYAYTYLYNTLGEKFKPPDLLKSKVESGELGIKTGRGFYIYEGKSVDAVLKRRDEWLIEQLKSRGLLKPKGNGNNDAVPK
ncbi:MAG: 3-hydroxyacyl-CoA dehydrogenase family protein [Candidatus Bathyarchaeota archaeon]|nr:3-hydroxyacyl-CoA dehydrogenase family protein [Candidatus Bathyarchaeota archaeon]